MCVGAQTPRSLLVPKRASVCAAERERPRPRVRDPRDDIPRVRQEEACAAAPRQPSASVSPRDRRVVRGPGLLKLLPRRGAFAHAAMLRPPARHALRHRHTRKAEQSAPPHLSQTGWGKRGSEDSVGRMNHSRWRRRAHPNQQWVQA